MTNILITGANGQVGSEFRRLSEDWPQLNFEFAGSEQLDITDEQKVLDFFSAHNFNFCVNCAAYTAVDKAENEAMLAAAVNELGARNVAIAAAAHHVHLIQLSTDYVYHNEMNRPLLENDPCEPKGVYARTKLAGDLAVMQAQPEATIIRTSWVYSSFGNNFVKTMIRLGSERDILDIVSDQIGTPTYARDLAAAILNIIRQLNRPEFDRRKAAGIFNYSNEGVASWYDFALAIWELADIKCIANPIPGSDFPSPANRPFYSVMSKEKIKNIFGMDIPYWRDSLAMCLHQLKLDTAVATSELQEDA